MFSDVLTVLNQLEQEGIYSRHALFGAMAAMYFSPAVTTEDLDVLVMMPPSGSTLVNLSPLYTRLAQLGFMPQAEHIVIHGLPVQFVPVFNPLVTEALKSASEATIQGVSTRVVSAEHLTAISVQTGRPKDLARVQELLSTGKVDRQALADICQRHGLRCPTL